jgi:hypothetical protein
MNGLTDEFHLETSALAHSYNSQPQATSDPIVSFDLRAKSEENVKLSVAVKNTCREVRAL